AWCAEVDAWRRTVEKFFSRNLHCYLLRFQPPKIATWLKLRIANPDRALLTTASTTGTSRTTTINSTTASRTINPTTNYDIKSNTNNIKSNYNAVSLGLSQAEVETLLMNESAEDVRRCREEIEQRLLKVLDVYDTLKADLMSQTITPVYKALEERVLSDLACLE
ncbi:unnamed protein product, partial [Amoebophrya sp. A25]